MNTANPPRLEVLITVVMGRLLGDFFKEYVDRLELKGNEHVLELGPSAGNSTRWLARRLQSGGRLTAVDISPVWIETARKQLKRLKNVRLIAGDICNLDLPDKSQDVVFISFVIHDISPEARRSVLQATLGKLKRGGKAYIREPLRFIRQEEIAGLMRSSGLVERSARAVEVRTQGMVFEGVYYKAIDGNPGRNG